jgi:hypothetical protein
VGSGFTFDLLSAVEELRVDSSTPLLERLRDTWEGHLPLGVAEP